MLLVMKYFDEKDVSKKAKVALIVVLCIGAITPMTEFIRTVKGEINVIKGIESAKSNSLTSIFVKENNECYENFIADTNSIFYKYLAK